MCHGGTVPGAGDRTPCTPQGPGPGPKGSNPPPPPPLPSGPGTTTDWLPGSIGLPCRARPSRSLPRCPTAKPRGAPPPPRSTPLGVGLLDRSRYLPRAGWHCSEGSGPHAIGPSAATPGRHTRPVRPIRRRTGGPGTKPAGAHPPVGTRATAGSEPPAVPRTMRPGAPWRHGCSSALPSVFPRTGRMRIRLIRFQSVLPSSTVGHAAWRFATSDRPWTCIPATSTPPEQPVQRFLRPSRKNPAGAVPEVMTAGSPNRPLDCPGKRPGTGNSGAAAVTGRMGRQCRRRLGDGAMGR